MCLHLERNATEPNLRIFDGFDANDRFENRLRDYARFLIDQGKWEALAFHFDDQHEHGNSHGPRIAIYRRMLAEFAPIWERKIREMDDYKLTAAEVKQVLDARVHPSNRPAAG